MNKRIELAENFGQVCAAPVSQKNDPRHRFILHMNLYWITFNCDPSVMMISGISL